MVLTPVPIGPEDNRTSPLEPEIIRRGKLGVAFPDTRRQVAYVLSTLGTDQTQLITNSWAVPRADVLEAILQGARAFTGQPTPERPASNALEFADQCTEVTIDRVLSWLALSKPQDGDQLSPLSRILAQYDQLTADQRQSLQPIFTAFGQALAAHGVCAGRTGRALYANTRPTTYQVDWDRYGSVQVHSWGKIASDLCDIVVNAFDRTRDGAMTDADCAGACRQLHDFCTAFDQLRFLRTNYPELYRTLDLRKFTQVQFVSQDGRSYTPKQIAELHRLITVSFGADRVPNFERERLSGRLTVHSVTKHTKRGPAIMDCATSYAIDDRWSALDWWARIPGDDGLAQACLVTGAESQRDRRQLYSCNWLAVTHDTQNLHGISVDMERSDDPPVPYLGSLVLTPEELARCPAKQPQYRRDVQEAERLAQARSGAFVPVQIGGQDHWAITVQLHSDEINAFWNARNEQRSATMGRELFAAMDHAQTLSEPAPVLVWCTASAEAGPPRSLTLVFGPNPVNAADMASFQAARKSFKEQLSALHATAEVPDPALPNSHRTPSAAGERAADSRSSSRIPGHPVA